MLATSRSNKLRRHAAGNAVENFQRVVTKLGDVTRLVTGQGADMGCQIHRVNTAMLAKVLCRISSNFTVP